MTQSDRPAPLTPPRSDLRDFGYMPLEIVRFKGSQLVSEEEPEAVLAALHLWVSAWHDTPAASLPNSDRALARAAGYGRAVDAFLAVKDVALRGFVLCSDGRLYHPVVARLANEAWKSKLEQRWRTEVGRRRKHNERHPESALSIPTFEAFAAVYPDDCREDMERMSQGQLGLVAATDGDCPPEIGSKGESSKVKERETLKNQSSSGNREAPEPASDAQVRDLLDLTNEITREAGVSIIKPSAVAREMDIVKRWIAEGYSVEDLILPTIRKRVSDMREDETVGSLAYFDASILKAAGKSKRPASSTPSGPAESAGPDDADPRIAKLRTALKASLGPRTYDGWIKPVSFRVNGETTTLVAPSAFLADWISGHLSDKLRTAVAATGLPSDLRIGHK